MSKSLILHTYMRTMSIRIFSLCFFVLCSKLVWSQYDLPFDRVDTLNYRYRSSGQQIDSLDLYNYQKIAALPYFNNPFGKQSDQYTDFPLHLQGNTRFQKLNTYFTALPHFGFAYTFGSSGTQFVTLDYQQTLREKSNLHVRYQRGKSNHFLRNNQSIQDEIQALYTFTGKKYSNLVYFNYLNRQQGHSWGIAQDSLLEETGLAFAPVRRDVAASKTKVLEVGSQHQWDLNPSGFKKDSLTKSAILYSNELAIKNRSYTDEGGLLDFYGFTYLKGDSTQDQRQLASLKNGLSYLFVKNHFKAHAGIEHNYWRFDNLGNQRDTNEVKVFVKLAYTGEKWQIQGRFDHWLVGADQGQAGSLQASYSQSAIQHRLLASYSNQLMQPFQRTYLANSYQWNLQNIQKQQQTKIDYILQTNHSYLPDFRLSYSNFANWYKFDGKDWVNNSASLSILQAQVSAKYRVGSWSFLPRLSYILSNMEEVPSVDARVRILYNKALFKARKFNYFFAIDASWRDAYRLSTYNAALDIMVLNPGSDARFSAQGMIDLMTGFEIDKIRFYIKYENLDYLWNDSRNQMQGFFPISPNIIRIGLTFDFVN